MTPSLRNVWIGIVLAFLCAAPLSAQIWSLLDDFPGVGRDDGASFVIGNTAYCGTGVASTFDAQFDFYAFDMPGAQWAPVASLPEWAARQYAVGFSHEGFGYIFGGVNGSSFLNDFWRYDPQADTWTQLASLPSEGRSGAMGFVIGETAYILGGKTAGAAALNEVWAYHIPTQSWLEKAAMPFGARWRAAAVAINGSGYLLGGMDEALVFQSGFYQYDAINDVWSTLTPFPGAGRNYMVMEEMSGVITAFGGFDATAALHNDLWIYDQNGADWVELNPLPADGRRGGMHFSDGASLYYTAGLFADFQRTKETWKAADILSIAQSPSAAGFTLYPNPSEGDIKLSIRGSGNCGQILIAVVDPSGRIRHQTFYTPQPTINLTLDNLPAGVYLIIVENGCERSAERVVKI